MSSILATVFSVMNKKYIELASPLVISCLEMTAGALVLSVVAPLMYGEQTLWFPNFNIHKLQLDQVREGPWDLIWVMVLSVLCTNLTFFLSTRSLKHISAFTSNLTVNLEPIYGILLGAIIFHENRQLNSEFYVGTLIILTAIFANPLLSLWDDSISPIEKISEEAKSKLSLLAKEKRTSKLSKTKSTEMEIISEKKLSPTNKYDDLSYEDDDEEMADNIAENVFLLLKEYDQVDTEKKHSDDNDNEI